MRVAWKLLPPLSPASPAVSGAPVQRIIKVRRDQNICAMVVSCTVA